MKLSNSKRTKRNLVSSITAMKILAILNNLTSGTRSLIFLGIILNETSLTFAIAFKSFTTLLFPPSPVYI